MSNMNAETKAMLASLLIWIQIQPYSSDKPLPDLSEIGDYLRITANGTILPFEQSTSELKQGEFLLVPYNGRLTDSTVYRISHIRKKVLTYESLDVTKYWTYFNQAKFYDRKYFEHSETFLRDLGEMTTEDNAIEDLRYICKAIYIVQADQDVTNEAFNKVIKAAVLRTQLRLVNASIANQNPFEYSTQPFVKDFPKFADKLKECPWMNEEIALTLIRGIQSPSGKVHGCAMDSELPESIRFAAFEADGRTFMITKDFLYEIIKDYPFQPRVFEYH